MGMSWIAQTYQTLLIKPYQSPIEVGKKGHREAYNKCIGKQNKGIFNIKKRVYSIYYWGWKMN